MEMMPYTNHIFRYFNISNPDMKQKKEGLSFNQTASNCSLNYSTV